MRTDKFDFDDAKEVAFAKFCDLVADEDLQNWFRVSTMSCGRQTGKNSWSISFIAYQKNFAPPELKEDNEDHIYSECSGSSQSSRVVLAPFENYSEIEIFHVILDANTGDIDVVSLVDLASVDLDSFLSIHNAV